jgi:phosphatidylserine/phosphatidylglycerophosphate/cardiolipin synthase-like enzyme
VPVKILFAPDHTPELEVVKQMRRAQQRVDFAIFAFADSSAIETRGDSAPTELRIRRAIGPTEGRQSWAATPWLHDAMIEVSFPCEEPGFGKLHHKVMVIDDAVVVAGSLNYAAPANEYDDENILVLGSQFADLTRQVCRSVDPAACAQAAPVLPGRDRADHCGRDAGGFALIEPTGEICSRHGGRATAARDG